MDLNKIGRFIYKLRKAKGLSQNGLADMIPVTRQAVSTWELGKSLPDSQTLVILSEIFDVTIDEILAGERNTPEKTTEEKNSEITLNLVDEYNSKSRKIKKITITFTFIIFSILLIFLGYYFINSYNTIKVYKVKGSNSNFTTSNGVIISTKQKIYIRIGELEIRDKEKNINEVKLYFIDKDNKKRVLYEDNKTDILVTFYHGYNEKFSNKELQYIIDKLYLEIKCEDKVEKMKLEVKKDFSNVFSMEKENDELDNKYDEETITPIIYEKIKKKMEKKALKTKEGYKLEIKEEDKNIEIELLDYILVINLTTEEYTERWKCYLENEISYSYRKRINNSAINVSKEFKDTDTMTPEEQKLHARIMEYINKYILLDN